MTQYTTTIDQIIYGNRGVADVLGDPAQTLQLILALADQAGMGAREQVKLEQLLADSLPITE